MKTRKIFIAIVLLLLISCSAEDGENGAVGPQGPQGEQGVQGPQGEIGNANVIALDWFSPDTYDLSERFGQNYLEHDETIPEITQEVLDNSVILTYAKLNSYFPEFWPRDQVGTLPITLIYSSTGSPKYIDHWSALATVGNLKISLVNNENLYVTFGPNNEFRCIIIPPNTASRANNFNFHKMSYEEVMDYFGLEY